MTTNETTKEEFIKGKTQELWERESNISYTEAEAKVRNDLRRWEE